MIAIGMIVILLILHSMGIFSSKKTVKKKKEMYVNYYTNTAARLGGGDPILATTSAWCQVFIDTNPGAQKIKDRLYIKDQNLYIRAQPYFMLKSLPARCVHPEGGSSAPEEGTRLVYHSDNCGDNPVPDKLKLYQDKNGILRLKNGACVAASGIEGNELYYTYKWCDGQNITPNQGKEVISSDKNGGVYLQTMYSPNGYFRLEMQPDGNLVMYDNTNAVIWNSQTYNRGTSPFKLVMQSDGNLVIYDANGWASWNTRTHNQGVGPYRLVLQDDSNLVIYDATGKALWASNTVNVVPTPFDFVVNPSYTQGNYGVLKHRNTGRCVGPAGGYAGQGTRLVTTSNCKSSLMRQDLPLEQDQLIGFADDNHVGQLRMSDGQWIPIGDAFQLIAGPGSSTENFGFIQSDMEWFTFLDTLQSDWKHMTPNEKKEYFSHNREYFRRLCWPWESCAWNWAEDLYNKARDGLMTAGDWIKARASDVAAFTQAAASSVGTWAKNAANSTLDWAKGAGQLVVKNLIDIGNKIGSFARDAANKIKETAVNTVNTIKDFFVDIYGKARDAFEKAINWIKGAASFVWDKIGGTVGIFLNIMLQGAPCEYYVARKISGLEAVKALEGPLIPNLRDIMIEVVKSALSAVTAGILAPLLAVIIPIVQQFSDFNAKIDGLLISLFEQNFMISAITTVADPIVTNLMSKGCSMFSPPDVSDIDIKIDINLDDILLDDSAFDD